MDKVRRFIRKLRRYYSDVDYRGQVRERLKLSWLNLRIALRPHNLDLYDARADQFSSLEMYAHAARDYTRMLELFPMYGKSLSDHPIEYLYAERAETYSERKRWEDAIQDYSSAIAHAEIDKRDKMEVSPDELEVLQASVYGYSRAHLYSERAECHAAIWRSSGDADSLSRALDDFNKAIEILDESAGEDPDCFISYLRRGHCWKQVFHLNGDKSALVHALADFDKAAEMDSSGFPLCSKASALEEAGDFEGALAVADTIIERGGSYVPHAHLLRSSVFRKNGDFLAAISAHDNFVLHILQHWDNLVVAPEPPFVNVEVLPEPKRSKVASSLVNHHNSRAELWEEHGDPQRAEEDRQRAREYKEMVTVRPVHSLRNFRAYYPRRPSASTANT